MTERKPPEVSFESWIDKQIREAQERGDFEDLPGAGKPLPRGDEGEAWWIKGYLRREGLSGEALLPPSLRLRKEVQRLPETVSELPTERAVRDAVAELNRRIAEHLRAPSGPPVVIGPVDAEEVVRGWRDARPVPTAPTTPAAAPGTEPAPARAPWWRRVLGRR
ncbi:DUF1992 domain-containing protein [Saccharopolyspora cebuensis]|uniref:DnaJ family domain-containing protein n=1 Tax=Saccharopolyspora cebuensis TaxID=418759 RepID=UPI0031EDFBFB